MKNKVLDPIVTESKLKNALEHQTNFLLEKFDEYKDEVLTRMDKYFSSLEQMREDQDFIKHDIQDHTERIIKLEQAAHTH